ncbi:hypothetical protein V6N13_009210 [Hibiscus sabdariffa]|uniref:Uncharacterized protein n=1 Tax=Hibiscus sabdariffa TaxID=183260 RepID=A0ABR2DKF6_9ROSI
MDEGGTPRTKELVIASGRSSPARELAKGRALLASLERGPDMYSRLSPGLSDASSDSGVVEIFLPMKAPVSQSRGEEVDSSIMTEGLNETSQRCL